MSIGLLITKIVSALLLPPLNLTLSALLGFSLRKRWPRFGISLCLLSIITLLALCTGAGSRLLVAPLENSVAPLTSATGTMAQAIVVLGGGRYKRAAEYNGQDVPGLLAQARLRYAARLHRQTGLPLLVTGGSPDGSTESEAALMARLLKEDYKIDVKWLEQASENTAQNAEFSARLLKPQGVQRILLVTDAMHMPRSQLIFRDRGFDVIAAPTLFQATQPLTAMAFLPSGDKLGMSHYAMHEWLGIAWYRLRHKRPEALQQAQ